MNKTDSIIRLLQEKLCREHSLTQEEIKAAVITIKDGKVTIKKGK